MITQLPTGTITFLFTDIESSTRRWEQHPERMRLAVARHDELLRVAIESAEGYVFKTIGDAFCAAFDTAPAALAAGLAALTSLEREDWGELGPLRVRVALWTGEAELRDDDYFGPPLNRVARLLSAGHGGQLLLSQSTVELVREALPDRVSLLDLGQHRLKDLPRAVRIFQAVHPDLPSTFPPLRSLDHRLHNLPAQSTPFVGREAELASVRQRLSMPEVRLLTLTGPGGTGKTRLAIEAATGLADEFGDGVFFVPLASIDDPALLSGAILEALAVHESETREPLSLLKEVLRDKRSLLLLDNFEQLLTGATLVADLLVSSPGLKVLVTSRALLHLSGEYDLPVPPLTLPDPAHLPSLERLSQFEAVHLFIERARAVRPNFAITNENAPCVAEICHRLDGLPLAIELAAAWIRLLSPQAILARLDRRLPLLTGGARDLPARQQTLRGAIAWGYDLLDPAEQLGFRQLGVFSGSFSLEAASEVVAGVDVFDLVTSLVDRSLLRQDDGSSGEPRFRLLETIREFAREELETHGEIDQTSQRHAEYFLELTSRAVPGLRGPEQLRWFAELDQDRGNLRAALRRFAATSQLEAELTIIARIWWYWLMRGNLRSGRTMAEDALARSESLGPTAARASALFAAGALAWTQGDHGPARQALEQSLAMAEAGGDLQIVGHSLTILGALRGARGDSAAARAAFARSLQVLERLGDRWGRALSLFFQGNAALAWGDLALVRRSAEASLELFEQVQDAWGRSLSLALLGRLALQNRDFDSARVRFEEGLSIRESLGDNWGTAQLLNSLGDTARAGGDHEGAAASYERSLLLFREVGARAVAASVLHNLGYVALRQDDPDRAERLFLDSIGTFRDHDDRAGIADGLAGLGAVAAERGQARRAARLLGCSDAQLMLFGITRSSTNQNEFNRAVGRVRSELPEPGFTEAWCDGEKQSPDELLDAEGLLTTI